MYKNLKVIAMDLDGTLTQHKTPLSHAHRQLLLKLSERYTLLMVGAGQVMRIFYQLEKFPIDIIGNYGMQYGKYDPETQSMDIVKDVTLACDRENIIQKSTCCVNDIISPNMRAKQWNFIRQVVLLFRSLGQKQSRRTSLFLIQIA